MVEALHEPLAWDLYIFMLVLIGNGIQISMYILKIEIIEAVNLNVFFLTKLEGNTKIIIIYLNMIF